MRILLALYISLALYAHALADEPLPIHFTIDTLSDTIVDVTVEDSTRSGCPAVPTRNRTRSTELFAARLAMEFGRTQQDHAQTQLDRIVQAGASEDSPAFRSYEAALYEAQGYLAFAHQIATVCNDGLLRAEVSALLFNPPVMSLVIRTETSE